jgi:Domain of unknown function (DUF6265)
MNDRKKACLVMLFAIMITFSCSNHKENKQVKKFNWLSGSWVMKYGESTTTENWNSERDTVMVGTSAYSPKIGIPPQPFENIKLTIRNESYCYIVTSATKKESPVVFTIEKYTDSSFVAENLIHDFPKRIGYILVNKDSIHAWIDGGSADTATRENFYYSRHK